MRKWKSLTALLLSSALLVSAISAFPVNVSGAGETAISLNNPSIKDGVTTWDCVEFGQYWQEDTNGDGKTDENDTMTPIKWRVLSVSNDEVFLMADQCLDWMEYSDTPDTVPTWKDSLLRYWLNNIFHRDAFSAEEQDAMKIVTVSSDNNAENDTQDKLYILSYSDISNTAYGFDADASSASQSRCAQKGGFAITMTKRTFGDENDKGWWLRTLDNSNAKVVQSDGSTSDQSATSNKGVRPVVNVKLFAASTTLKKVSSVSSNSENPAATQKPTNTPKPTTTIKPTTTTKPTVTKKPSVSKKKVTKGKAPNFSAKYKKKDKNGTYNLINVKIKLPKNAAGYQIRYKWPKTSRWIICTRAKTKSNSTLLNAYKKGTFKIQVRSYTKNKASYSKWSKTKKVKVKKVYIPKASSTEGDSVG